MPDLLSSEVLQELMAVEGRYIEWEWDPQTLKSDYITLSQASGHAVVEHDKSSREFNLSVRREVIQRLIGERLVCEDELKRSSGFRVYRLARKENDERGSDRSFAQAAQGALDTSAI
jgi:hypothetical protein